MMDEMTRQMMEEICLDRLCERDVSADYGVALDGWGTGLSPDDGDRLLSPNKENAFWKKKNSIINNSNNNKTSKKRTAETSTKSA